MNKNCPDEILWRHIRDLPYFRAMVRATEDCFYQGMTFEKPVLDVGCGDGHFASVAFSTKLDVGVDPWGPPILEARTRNIYDVLIQADAAHIPYPDNWFSTAISNSVLEHIPHVDAVVEDVARVVKPSGLFIFCVPNHRFPEKLLGTQIFRSLHWEAAAKGYSRFFNRISRHQHCDSPQTWRERLDRFGFDLVDTWDYFSPAGLHVMEMGHAFGLPALIWKMLTGRWILVQNRANLSVPLTITRPYVQNPISEEGVYSFFIARRRA